MNAFITLFFTLILSLLLSMTLAIYLPLNDVNRMFVAGLSVPFLLPLLWVFILTIESRRMRIFTYTVGTPVLSTLVFVRLAGPLGLV